MSLFGAIKKWFSAPKQTGQPVERKVVLTQQRGGWSAVGYQSALVATKEGRQASPGSGDSHAKYHREQLLNQSREFIRDDGIYAGMRRRFTSYVIGAGFTLQAKTDDLVWNSKIEALWKEWAKDCEIRGLMDWPRVQAMYSDELFTCGDAFVVKENTTGKLQILESEQVRGSKQQGDDGVVKDEFGRPLQFKVMRYNEQGQLTGDPKTYEADQICFTVVLERPSSTRGVPPCQSIFSMLHRITEVCNSEAIAWQIAARFAIAITRDGGANDMFNNSKEDDAVAGDEEGKLTTRVTELDNAIIFSGEKGDQIQGIERNLPGQNFPESIRMFIQLLGTPMGLPLEMLLLDWTKSNYSQSRAVLEQAFVNFLQWQALIRRFFHESVYKWFVGRMVSAGKIGAHEQQFAHDWIMPSFPWIDALLEAQAWGAKLDRSLATHAQALKSLNLDPDEVLAQRKTEILKAIETAKEIEAKTGEKVDWRILCGLAAGVNGPPPPQPAEKKSEEKPEKTGKAPERKAA